MMNTDELAPIDHEPTPQDALKNGIDLVCFSGDKLLGGPQSGIIAGRADLVAGIKKEPFFRAVRCDKLILTVLQESIDEYLRTQSDPSQTDIPTLRNLAETTANLQARADHILSNIGKVSKAEVTSTESTATTGGGTMPTSQIPSIAISMKPTGISLNKLSHALRTGTPAIVGYTDQEKLCLDLRTIFHWQDEAVASRLSELLT
jgi:L-seryl-tRNA(Ser) seleniumtransferase